MASDVPLLFIAMLVVVLGAGAVALMIPAARRRQRLLAEARDRRLMKGSRDLEDYLSKLAQAETDEDIDRLGKGE